MISANELRIGNWFKNGNNFYQSTGVLKLGSYYKSITGHGDIFAYYEALEPIPLTEKILLKCGFEKILTFNEWRRNKILKHEHFNFPLYEHEKINMYLYPFFGGNFLFYNGCTMNVSHMPYLHQLQNLYYALTGKELEINL